jgi:formylglycine-generating enzyme required for sulfatase activity
MKIIQIMLLLFSYPLIGGAKTIYFGFYSGDFSDVGNPGNQADSLTHVGYGGSVGFGAVAYNYKISKYETTVGQYVEFLNAVAPYVSQFGLYNPNSGIIFDNGTYTVGTGRGSANKPITYVSYYDALRYINWVANGATSNASTENGSYTIVNGGVDSGVVSGRNPAALFVLPTENEWYKAAYNKGPSSTDYSDHPTDAGNMFEPEYPNLANRGLGTTVDVGSYGVGYYGTYDMAGNVWEYSETYLGIVNGIETYVVRGGAYVGYGGYDSDASSRGDTYNLTSSHTGQDENVGFRVALVPEPSAFSLLAVGLGGLAMMRRRRS